jgi:hypothetical protein
MTRLEQLEAENARLRAEHAPRCIGNIQHDKPCDECGYCERCHFTVYGRGGEPHPFTRKAS